MIQLAAPERLALREPESREDDLDTFGVQVWKPHLGSECSWALLGYISARGMNALRRDASIREYGNGNVELPLRATSSLTRRAIPEPLKVPPDRD